MQFNITFKTIFEYVLKKLVLCIQIRFVSTEKTTRIASRASCLYRVDAHVRISSMLRNKLHTCIILCWSYRKSRKPVELDFTLNFIELEGISLIMTYR